jgi:spermidine synthase
VEGKAGNRVIHTLLTNGKFQGNDDVGGEMPAQVGVAVAPLLHTPERGAALVIGYGSGVSTRTMHDAGFERLDLVELSADVLRLADGHFAAINGGASSRPRVHTYVTDGRNFLMLQPRTYDVISLEISSIWFSGAASLYNREFYQLVRRRLRADGVLQQWIQLHHIEPVDLLYVLGSVRAELRYVWLYFIGGQGIIVASNDASRVPRRANFEVLERSPSFRPLLQMLRGFPNPFDAVLLDPAGTDAFLSAFGRPAESWRSTDDNLFLEYHTPRGNALDTERSFQENLRILARFGPRARAAKDAEGRVP